MILHVLLKISEDVKNTTDTSETTDETPNETPNETTGETSNETTDETTDETKVITEEPTENSAKNEIELTLDVDADEKIVLNLESETNGWTLKKHDEGFYTFYYQEYDINFSIACSEDDDSWTLKCRENRTVTCSWQWQTKGTGVVGAAMRWTNLGTTMEGYMSVCPSEYNSEDSLRCILTWNLKATNEYTVTVTINFEND